MGVRDAPLFLGGSKVFHFLVGFFLGCLILLATSVPRAGAEYPYPGCTGSLTPPLCGAGICRGNDTCKTGIMNPATCTCQ